MVSDNFALNTDLDKSEVISARARVLGPTGQGGLVRTQKTPIFSMALSVITASITARWSCTADAGTWGQSRDSGPRGLSLPLLHLAWQRAANEQ